MDNAKSQQSRPETRHEQKSLEAQSAKQKKCASEMQRRQEIRNFRRKKTAEQEKDPFGLNTDEKRQPLSPKRKMAKNSERAADTSQYSGNSSHVIDLPRHLKVTSKEQSLRNARIMLREQQFHHTKFEPSLHSYSQKHFYKGVYTANQRNDPSLERKINVSDFIRLECPKTMRN